MVTKVYLSPSSQSENPYSAGGTNEQRQCNRIADAAKAALERNGFAVKKAPEGQGYVQNVAESNAWGANIHMPIHTNAGGSSKGTMGLCYQGCVSNKYMQAVYNAVAAATPWGDIGISTRSDLYEINMSDCMCVYLEMAFHDKADSAQWIIDNVTALGEAIAKGMCAAEGKQYIPPEGVNPQSPGAAKNNAGLWYRAHVEDYGWLDAVHDGQVAGTTGKGKRLEAIKIDTRKLDGVKLRVTAHIENVGNVDYGYIDHDTVIGTIGEKKRLEAVDIIAEGLDGKKIYTQAHFDKSGWSTAVPGGSAGTFGLKKEVQAIRIWIS